MPPVVIGAGIAAAATVGGAALTSSANKKATNKAVAAQQSSDAQQLAYQREARDKNEAALSPFMQRGNVAGDQINALLGLGGSAQTLPTQQPGILAQYQGENPDTSAHGLGRGYETVGGDPFGFNKTRYEAVNGGPGTIQNFGATQAPQQARQTPQQAAMAAYDIFKNSTGYQTRLKEGQGALAANYFGGGVGQSGAAMKAAIRYGNDYAGNYFDNYIGQLGNQQNLGFAGASALSGVSQNFANNASNISQNGANILSQAAIARAQNSGALYTGIAGAIGNVAGSLSSYGR